MEVLGNMIQGYASACKNLRLIAGERALKLTEDIDYNKWYPLERWQELGMIIEAEYENPGPIMEMVGIEVMQGWYNHGPGKEVIHNCIDFLKYQTGSNGYKSVVKGDSSIVGDFKLVFCDEEKHQAKVESTTPFNRDMERGILIGGMKVPGQDSYVSVDNSENPDIFLITFFLDEVN